MSNEIMLTQNQNPLSIFGLEPWTIKSLPKEMRKQFIASTAKLLSQYHHPDRYVLATQEEQRKHAEYYKKIQEAANALKDPFTLEEALSEFNTQKDPKVDLELRLQAAQQKLTALERQLAVVSKIAANPEINYEKLKQDAMSRWARIQQAQGYAITYRTPLQQRLRGTVTFSLLQAYDEDTVRKILDDPKNTERNLKNYFTTSASEEKVTAELNKGILKTPQKDKYSLLGTVLYGAMAEMDSDPHKIITSANYNKYSMRAADLFNSTVNPFISPVLDTGDSGLAVIDVKSQKDSSLEGFHAAFVYIHDFTVSLHDKPPKKSHTA